MMDTITERITKIVDEMTTLRDIALEAEAAGYEFSQDELRALFENLKRLNGELGRTQFDMMNDPAWDFLTEEDREELKLFVSKTIAGWNMIKEAMGEAPEAQQ